MMDTNTPPSKRSSMPFCFLVLPSKASISNHFRRPDLTFEIHLASKPDNLHSFTTHTLWKPLVPHSLVEPPVRFPPSTPSRAYAFFALKSSTLIGSWDRLSVNQIHIHSTRLKTMAASLTQSTYSYLGGPSADQPSDRVLCTHDRNTKLHPPCYANDDSARVDRCIEYFTGQHEWPLWPKRSQNEALDRWSQCHHRLDISLWEEGLDLQYFFHLFDDFIFCAPGRALAHLVEVQWIDHNPKASPCQTKAIPSTGIHPHALIQIQKADPSLPFTGHTAQRILGALLHGMTHAFFICYGCPCLSCRCDVTRSRTVGVPGPRRLARTRAAGIEDV